MGIRLATALCLCAASSSAHVWIDLETDDGTRYVKAGDCVVVAGSPPLIPAMRRPSGLRSPVASTAG